MPCAVDGAALAEVASAAAPNVLSFVLWAVPLACNLVFAKAFPS